MVIVVGLGQDGDCGRIGGKMVIVVGLEQDGDCGKIDWW